MDTWTAVAPTSGWPSGAPYGAVLHGITYGQGQYVAVGEYWGTDFGFTATSTNGVNWTVTSKPMSVLNLYDVAWGNGVFVAVGYDWYSGASVYHSTDGVDWTMHSTTSGNVNAVTFAGGQFVAVGDGLLASGSTTSDIYTSTYGTNWTARNSGAATAPNLCDIAYGNGRYVAQDYQGYFYTSLSGTSWSIRGSGDPSYNAPSFVSFAKDRFVALTPKGTNLVSTDGLNWAPMTRNVTNPFRRVLYQAPYFLALSGPALFSSTDGTNWMQRNLTPPAGTQWTDLVVGSSNLVVVGYTYNYGQPGVPVASVSGPFVTLGMAAGAPARLSLSGWSGRSCQIQSVDSLKAASSAWQTLTTLVLTNTPTLWTDPTATNSQRYYRAVLP